MKNKIVRERGIERESACIMKKREIKWLNERKRETYIYREN